MAELTVNGYVVKTQNQYFQEERQLYIGIDAKWNLGPSTPDGLKIASDSEIFGNIDEQLQLAYNSKDPNKSEGLELDIVCALTDTFREDGTNSVINLTLSGTAGTPIPQGSQVKNTITGDIWQTTAPLALPGTVDASAVEVGAINASIGQITTIVDSISGWTGVTNVGTASLVGRGEQNDTSLRLERNASVGKPGNNQTDSLIGILFSVENVTNVRVWENFTSGVDANGIPAHNLAIYVLGGTNSEIAEAIYTKKNPGVGLWDDPANATVQVVVESQEYSWNTKLITFNRPTIIPILVVVTITDDGSLPGTIAQDVKDSIVAYAVGGELAEECGFNNSGFDINEDVVYSRMYTPVNQVIGQYGNSYITVLTINGGTANIFIDFNEISQFTDPNITVNIV